MARGLGLKDPPRRWGRPLSSCPIRRRRWSCTSRTRPCFATGEAAALQAREARDGADGGEEWDLVTRLPLRDRGRRRSSASSTIFRDVTEQKRAEREDPGRRRRRDQFLAMLSHELRNPLGAIVTATALLKSTAPRRRRPDRFLDILERQSRADGAPAGRSAGGEPRDPEQDRPQEAGGRSERGRARRGRGDARADGGARAAASRSTSTTSRSGSTAIRRGCSRFR